MKFFTGHKVTGGVNHGTHAEVTFEPVKGGDPTTLTCDHVLVATGRRAYSDNLNAEKIGIKFDDKKRVIVNDHF